MADIFKKTLTVRWVDMDANGHMGNAAYLNICSDVRFMYFAEHGFPTSEFHRLRIGPVVKRDEIEYFREFRLLERMTVTLTMLGLSEDASRFRLQNEFFREDGKLAARVISHGGWLDLVARKLTPPPPKLAELLLSLAKGDDFEMLKPSG